MTHGTPETSATERPDEPCSGALVWQGINVPAVCPRCGATADDLCGDFDAQEAQWNLAQTASVAKEDS